MTPNTFYIYGNLDFLGKTAAAKRMLYYAKALADKGHAVYLVSACSDKFTEKDFVQIETNVFVLAKKKLTYSFFASFSFLKYLNRFSENREGPKSFLLYPQSWFYLELLSPLYLILFKKHSVYYELNEVKKYASSFHEPQSLMKLKYAIKTFVFKSKFIVMDSLMRFYKGLICISRDIETYGKRYNTTTLRVPILTDPEITFSTTTATYTKRGKFNIGFSGSILPSKENLFEFFEVVKKLNDNEFEVALNLCGSITDKNLNILSEMNQNSISYYGNLNENELSNFITQQDLLVLPRGFTLQNKYGFSTKLSDYLNHKKVILITDISDNALYIKDGVNGFVVDPNNSNMMYERIVHIIENFELIKEPIIKNAYSTSKEDFDYRLYKEALQTFLKA